MTDDVTRELVTRHDAVISSLVSSVEHLVSSQTETNKRLEEISKFLAKQQVFATKFELMDKELLESFKRVHDRIAKLEDTQTSDRGCSSMKLLTKEVSTITRDINKLTANVEIQVSHIAELEVHKSKMISPATIRWIAGILIAYTVIFGVYVVESFNKLNTTIATVALKDNENSKDVALLMTEHYKTHKVKGPR